MIDIGRDLDAGYQRLESSRTLAAKDLITGDRDSRFWRRGIPFQQDAGRLGAGNRSKDDRPDDSKRQDSHRCKRNDRGSFQLSITPGSLPAVFV